MKVFVTSSAEAWQDGADHDRAPARLLREAAAADRHRRHALAPDPDAADILLFVESHRDDAFSGDYFGRLRAHPWYRRDPARCFVHSGKDQIIPTIPGIFPSITRRWRLAARTRSGPYLVEANPFLNHTPFGEATIRYLASFVGAFSSVPLRHAMGRAIDDPAILIRDTTAEFIGSLRRGDQAGHDALKESFVATTAESLFVLCPRGFGAATIRLFEVLQMGRVPVIISDQWVPPPGPEWDAFSVRIAEDSLATLPSTLRALEDRAEEMGRRARASWERHYGPESLFDTIVNTCASLREAGPLSRTWGRLASRLQFARPRHLRALLRNRR